MTIKNVSLLLTGILFALTPVFAEDMARNRSFGELFSGLNADYQSAAFTEGIVRTVARGGSLELLPSPGAGIDLPQRIMAKGYPFLTESIQVIPYAENPMKLLDAYNALGRIQSLKGRLYHSHSRNQDVALFEDAVRMESERKYNPIPDPPPASALPASETLYIRLKDVNFGNTYYRAQITPEGRGLLFSLTNYRTISYFIFSVMKQEKFSALLYMEPLAEGMLIYSVAGTDVDDFIAGRIDIPSAIAKRLAVFTDWIKDGLGGR